MMPIAPAPNASGKRKDYKDPIQEVDTVFFRERRRKTFFSAGARGGSLNSSGLSDLAWAFRMDVCLRCEELRLVGSSVWSSPFWA